MTNNIFIWFTINVSITNLLKRCKMKTNLNLTYSSIRQSKPKYGLENSHSGSMCNSEEKKVNRGYYSGSFTSREKAAAGFWFRTIDKLIDGCNDHTVIIQNLVALGLAAGPRPIAIMSLPGKKNWEDKVMAACHSIASAVVGFVFASIVMYPLGEAAKRIYNPRKKTGDAVIIQNKFKDITDRMLDSILPKLGVTKEQYLKNPHIVDKAKYDKFAQEFLEGLKIKDVDLLKDTKIVGKKFLKLFGEFKEGQLVKINSKLNIDRVIKALNMAPDTFVFGVLKAMLTIALIPPIMKYIFGLSKEEPKQATVQAPQKAEESAKVGGAK